MKKLFAIKELSKSSGLTTYAIRKAVKQKRLSHIRTSGDKGKILIDEDAFDIWLYTESNRNISDEPDFRNYGKLRKIGE